MAADRPLSTTAGISIFDSAQKQAIQKADFNVSTSRDSYTINITQPPANSIVSGIEGLFRRLSQIVWGRKQNTSSTQLPSRQPETLEESVPNTVTALAAEQDTQPMVTTAPTSSGLPATSSHTPVYDDYGIYVSRADFSERWHEEHRGIPVTELTKSEAYVRNMIGQGKGLPCADPRPHKPLSREKGVLPGDVGIYTYERSFRKIFNLWEGEHATRLASYNLPTLKIDRHEDEIVGGQVIATGASVKRIMASSSSHNDSWQFHCTAKEGSILVSLSSADLEELADPVTLRNFIVQNATAIYMYSNKLRQLDVHESLYIVTGSIKNDGWAIAGYKDQMSAPNDILRLVGNGRESEPTHIWTDQGTADARSGPNPSAEMYYKAKNQCLFLSGFKISFSPSFRDRMKRPLDTVRGDAEVLPNAEGDVDMSSDGNDPSQGLPETDSNADLGPEPSDSQRDSAGPASGQTGRGGETLHYSAMAAGSSIPRGRIAKHLYWARFPDPYDIINQTLLDTHDIDVAISHDADWRTILEGCDWNRYAHPYLMSELKASRRLVVRQRVAMYVEGERLSPETSGSNAVGTKSNGSITKLNNLTQQLFGAHAHSIILAWAVEDPLKLWYSEARVVAVDGRFWTVGRGSAPQRMRAKDSASEVACHALRKIYEKELKGL